MNTLSNGLESAHRPAIVKPLKTFVNTGLFCCLLMLCSGCSTTGRELAYDNTVQVVKRPLSGTAELGWRVKTFWTEEATSLWRRQVSFRLLNHRNIPALEAEREWMERDVMAGWLRRKTGPPVQGTACLLLNGENFFPQLAESIRTATNSIDFKTYIFDNDDVAKQVADLLKSRSREVYVRILYDSFGTRAAWKVDADSLPGNYICETDDMIRYLAKDSDIALRRACHTMLTSEHSKYIIVDGRIAYFGGMNIGREYRYDWRDAMFELSGPVIAALETHFETAWMLATGDTLTLLKLPKSATAGSAGDYELYPAVTTPFKPHIYKGQLHAIKNARHHIYIENPYLWNPSILYQLCAARKRGVDVRVTIPRDVNNAIGAGANKVAVSRLLEHGVRVFIYPGMTHVKAAVYDQWACFGSANFDSLSLHKNYELNLFTDNPQIVGEIREKLLEDGQRQSTEVFSPEGTGLTDVFSARAAQYL